MPVYNGADYLPAAIESILAQHFGDFDLLISDNASTDATGEICRSFASRDNRIRYVRQPRNLGAAGNHNFLVTQSDSRYFKWAAHDDVLAPDFLGAAVDILDRRAEIVLASPASALVDEAGELLPFNPERGGMVDSANVCWPPLPERNDGLTSANPAVRFEAVMLKMVMCVEIFGLMRRSALLRTSLQGPFGGADKVLLAQMALAGPFWLGQEVLFFRRCHAKQFSSSSSGAYRAVWFSGKKDSISQQQLKLLVAYCRAVGRTDLPLRQKINCLTAIAHRALVRKHQWRRLSGALVGN
jgi:glycosyltransferase involved in cell wall biosynthesis